VLPWSSATWRASVTRAGYRYLKKRAAKSRLEVWGLQMHKFNERRSPLRLSDEAVPGFYRVSIGSLVEIGDQMLDESGRPRPISLDQVGRVVTQERVVLRIDRRQPED
jgi:hypothetical protein